MKTVNKLTCLLGQPKTQSLLRKGLIQSMKDIKLSIITMLSHNSSCLQLNKLKLILLVCSKTLGEAVLGNSLIASSKLSFSNRFKHFSSSNMGHLKHNFLEQGQKLLRIQVEFFKSLKLSSMTS